MLRNYRLQNYNFKLLFNVLVLMAMGLLFIHSANPSFVVKQALGITMGLGIIIVVSLIDFQVFTRNAEILYIFNVIMLIGVKLFGKDVNGAKRWFSLGPLGTFQPSELSKVIMIIVIAAFLVKHQDDLNEPKILGKLALVCAVPLLLILKQPSLSSTLDICFIILGSYIDYWSTTFSNLFMVRPDAWTGFTRAASGGQDHVIFTSRELCRFNSSSDKQFNYGNRIWRIIWKRFWK